MRKEGTIVRWDDAKGFGFIRGDSIAQDVFLHVRDFRAHAGEAPRQGLRVSFDNIHVGSKGPRAVAVQPMVIGHAHRPDRQRSPPAPHRKPQTRRSDRVPQSGAWFALPLMMAYAVALTWLVWQRQLPWWVLPVSLSLNLATFFAYWQDKYAAQQRRWRVKENTLHLWGLAGGWGGAWFAQQVLRHKSSKKSFRSAYWASVVIHCGGAAGIWWFWRGA